MIVDDLTQTIPIPHEPDEWITFAHPSWSDLELAKTRHLVGAFGRIRDLREAAGADLYDQIANTRKDTDNPQTTAVAVPADPWQEYDKAHILATGIKAWSYVDQAGNPIPVTPETIARLDPETAQWAGLTLLNLSRNGFSAQPVSRNESGEYVDTTASQREEADLAPLSR